MTVQPSVLALGSPDRRVWELAERANRLGFQIVRCKTVENAIAMRAERGFQFGAALIDSELPATELAGALDTMRTRLEAPELEFIATGERPDASARRRLREGGVELALWHPVSDHELRFQLNRALAHLPPSLLRGELRVPTDWNAIVFSSGRQKRADIYSVSGGGAFLATAQPSVSGAEVAVELPLSGGPVTLDGRVIYTNVPGNLKSKRLPNGMAVRWNIAYGEEIRAVRAAVDETAARLSV